MLIAVPLGFAPGAPVFIIGCCIVYEIGIPRGIPTPGSSGT
jgi:hypothetical protein